MGDMFRTFNMGIGFTVVVPESDVDATLAGLESSDVGAAVIGHIVEGERAVEIR
jgi:phosphoribosylformylglycinamidine cyclo-ligase